MFNPQTFENSRPDGFPVLEIVDEPRHDSPRDDRPRHFVPLRRTDLAGEVDGPVAALVVRQVFRFSREQFAKPIEAVYRFPLPGDAAVSGVRVTFGEVEIVAELAERAAAEQMFQAARDEGRQAALLTREAPDTFTLQVVGLKPDEDVTIQTRYAQLARPDGDGWTLRLPLTTVPRFVRGDEHGSPPATGQPLAVLRDPGHRFTLDLTLAAAERVTSPTHALDVSQSEGRLRVRLRDGEVLPDRDCVLSWQPERHADGPSLQVLRHADADDGAACHFLALVAPPAAPTPSETLPREAIILIDHSGSMSGPKWEAADWAVQNLLAGLTSSDTFNLGLFHTTTRWFAQQPVRGDERTTRQAREFLLQHKDSGGTELGVALEQALGQPRDADDRARHVLIVTDAQVSDAGRILALAEREAARPNRRRIDVLCIDAAPNSGLANELVERGGGIARFLTSDPAENDIASALDEVLADWAAPILRDLTLEVNSAAVQAAGRRVSSTGGERSAIDLGNLPAGRAVWVAGRIDTPRRQGTGTTLAFRLLADGRVIATDQPGADTAPDSHPAVAALFGARRILDIELAQTSGVDLAERLRQLGYDPHEVLEQPGRSSETLIYPENARRRSTDALRDLLVRESLRYGIACSATAFVATRHEAGERVAGTVAVANALAHGWSPDFLMSRMAMAAPMAASAPPFMPAPMAAPPPGAMIQEWTRFSQAPPDQNPASPQRPPGDRFGGPDVSALASGPFNPPRDLTRRLREGGRSRRPASGGGASAPGHPISHHDEMTLTPATGHTIVFSGTPRFAGSEAVLFDSEAAPGHLSSGETLTQLVVRLLNGASRGTIDPALTILLYVDDLTAPRARVRLADLLRQGGERPLNVRWRPGEAVRLVLLDPSGAWADRAPSMEVALG